MAKQPSWSSSWIVPCPRRSCQAPANEPCKTRNGNVYDGCHVGRDRDAIFERLRRKRERD